MTDDAKAAAFAAFEKAYAAYPSQDNEGYIPERGGFKCGWFAGVAWAREQANAERIGIQTYVEALAAGNERIKELEAALEKQTTKETT